MPVPSDPYNFVNGVTTVDGDQLDARFLPLYRTLDPAQIGVDDSNVKPAGLSYASLAASIDARYETLLSVATSFVGGQAAGTYLTSGLGLLSPATDVKTMKARYLDPANFPSGPRSQKLRIAATAFVNAVTPLINLTFGLYPLTAFGGGGNALTATLGTVVPGSTALMTTPVASSPNHAESSDFAFPAAGFYALGLITSGTLPTNGAISFFSALEFRAA